MHTHMHTHTGPEAMSSGPSLPLPAAGSLGKLCQATEHTEASAGTKWGESALW